MADPGFPPGGGVNTQFSQKLHEIERIWKPGGGGGGGRAFKILLCRSTNWYVELSEVRNPLSLNPPLMDAMLIR